MFFIVCLIKSDIIYTSYTHTHPTYHIPLPFWIPLNVFNIICIIFFFAINRHNEINGLNGFPLGLVFCVVEDQCRLTGWINIQGQPLANRYGTHLFQQTGSPDQELAAWRRRERTKTEKGATSPKLLDMRWMPGQILHTNTGRKKNTVKHSWWSNISYIK